MGLYTMAFSTAFIIGPILGMWLAEQFGFGTLWYFMAGLTVLACLGLAYLKIIINKPSSISTKEIHKLQAK